MIDRYLMDDLVRWRESPRRKPLLLNGARQVGKTTLLEEFGRRHFDDLAIVNFDVDPLTKELFERDLDVDRLLRELSVRTGKQLRKGNTLLVFDEIQECPRAITSLKYFCENARHVPLCAAGSLLGVAIGREEGTGYPVGKVDHLDLHPLSFREFLDATGRRQLRQLVDEGNPCEFEAFSEMLLESLRYYLVVGGMPEPVQAFVERDDLLGVREIQASIALGYERDIAKHLSQADADCAIAAWRSLPTQLDHENKRFVLGEVGSRWRPDRIRRGITWLSQAGLVTEVPRVEVPSAPLWPSSYPYPFKLFCLDVGILGAMAGLDPSVVLSETAVFDDAKGAYVEQFACQQLVSDLHLNPFYWSPSDSSAETDFVVGRFQDVFALEVKGGGNVRSKSLAAMSRRYEWIIPVRLSPFGFKDQGWMRNVPLYAMADVSLWGEGVPSGGNARSRSLSPKEREVLVYVNSHSKAAYEEIAGAVGVSRSTVMRAIRNLKAEGLLRREGPKSDSTWVVMNRPDEVAGR